MQYMLLIYSTKGEWAADGEARQRAARIPSARHGVVEVRPVVMERAEVPA